MSDNSRIEWTDASWNPVTGCTKVSPGCAHCYAEAITLRFKRGPAFLPGIAKIELHPDRLDQPLRWKRGRRIFVNSMSDLFHEDVPDDFIIYVFSVMHEARQHTFQVLTKRPERMRSFVASMKLGEQFVYTRSPGMARDLFEGMTFPPPNVWLGVSVENQVWADRRIPLLLETPAAVRFLSVEPLLKPVDLSPWLVRVNACQARANSQEARDALRSIVQAAGRRMGPTIDWVIVGGESGPRHRPMELDWVRSLRDQCVAAGVPFFYKQPGGARPGGEAVLDGREWREFPA